MFYRAIICAFAHQQIRRESRDYRDTHPCNISFLLMRNIDKKRKNLRWFGCRWFIKNSLRLNLKARTLHTLINILRLWYVFVGRVISRYTLLFVRHWYSNRVKDGFLSRDNIPRKDLLAALPLRSLSALFPRTVVCLCLFVRLAVLEGRPTSR